MPDFKMQINRMSFYLSDLLQQNFLEKINFNTKSFHLIVLISNT